jgi:hypothetical protein
LNNGTLGIRIVKFLQIDFIVSILTSKGARTLCY